jgi:hypothetical protein
MTGMSCHVEHHFRRAFHSASDTHQEPEGHMSQNVTKYMYEYGEHHKALNIAKPSDT